VIKRAQMIGAMLCDFALIANGLVILCTEDMARAKADSGRVLKLPRI